LSLAFELLGLPILYGCGTHNSSAAAHTPCVQLGERLHYQHIQGTIFGAVRTKIRLQSCPELKIGLAFIGEPDPNYAKLESRATRTMSVVAFRAVADGFLVRSSGQYTFIAITLDQVVEDSSSVAPGDRYPSGRE